jgi:hypothetical protein
MTIYYCVLLINALASLIRAVSQLIATGRKGRSP